MFTHLRSTAASDVRSAVCADELPCYLAVVCMHDMYIHAWYLRTVLGASLTDCRRLRGLESHFVHLRRVCRCRSCAGRA